MILQKNDIFLRPLEERDIENMKYKSILKPHPIELGLRHNRYRKIVAKRDILIGEIFNLENVNFMRSEDELNCIYASNWKLVSGKVSKNLIKKNSLITKDSY